MTSDVAVRLRSPRGRPPPRFVVCWTGRALLRASPVPLVLAILWLSIPPARFVLGPLVLVFALEALLYVAVMPWWRHRVHRWEITDEVVYATSGWLWQRWRVIPLSQVETVATRRGPVQGMLGLLDVTFSTPSHPGTLRISCLTEAQVDQIAIRLPTLLRTAGYRRESAP